VLKKLRILVALGTTDKMLNLVSSYCEIAEYLRHIVDSCRKIGRTRIWSVRKSEAVRDKMAFLDSKAPLRSVKRVQFGILAPDEIVSAYLKCSVCYMVWLNSNIWWLLLIVDSDV